MSSLHRITAPANEMFAGNGKRSSSQERPMESLDGQGVPEIPGMTLSDDQYPASVPISNEDPLNLDSSPMIARMAEWMQNRRLTETRVRHYILLSTTVKFCHWPSFLELLRVGLRFLKGTAVTNGK